MLRRRFGFPIRWTVKQTSMRFHSDKINNHNYNSTIGKKIVFSDKNFYFLLRTLNVYSFLGLLS